MMKKKVLEPIVNAVFVPEGITITMPSYYKDKISDILQNNYGITIEEYLYQCIMWTINEPEKFKAWIEECRKEYDF